MADQKQSLPTWNCEIDVSGEITVGKKFQISCQGEAVPLKSDQLMIYAKELDPQTKHASLNNLKILEVIKSDEQQIKAIVTSYLTGKYETDGFFILSDGQQEVALNQLKFNVASVLPPNEKKDPYPAYPPWVIPVPIWFIVLIIALIVLPLYGIWRVLKKQRERRLLIDSLKKQKTVRSPFDEFHREIRAVEKKHGLEPQDTKAFVSDVEKSFRMYLIRELLVPANTWSNRQIFNELKSRHAKVWESSSKDIKRLFSEFERASRSNVSVNDCRQLYAMNIEVSEKIFKIASQTRGRE